MSRSPAFSPLGIDRVVLAGMGILTSSQGKGTGMSARVFNLAAFQKLNFRISQVFFLGKEFIFNYVQAYLDLVVSKYVYSSVLTNFCF